jgi:hypothetical protein
LRSKMNLPSLNEESTNHASSEDRSKILSLDLRK